MRIIHNALEKEEKEHRCKHCSSVLSYLKEDTRTIFYYHEGRYYYHKYLVCPVCGNKTLLNE